MRDRVTIECAAMRLREKLDQLEAEDKDLKYCALWRIYSQRLKALRWVLGEEETILLSKEAEELFKYLC